MGIFVSYAKTAECVAVALILAALMCIVAYKQLGILQSAGYSGKKYGKWLAKKSNMAWQRLGLLSMLCVLASAVVSMCFSFAGEWAAVVGFAPVIIFFIVYRWADGKVALRSPVTPTPRFKRLYVAMFLVCAVFSYLAVTLLNFADYVWNNGVYNVLRYCPLGIMAVLIIPFIFLSNAISKIYEVPRNNRFVKQAKQKLASSHIKVIAVTGSYGKTSTKFILNHILSSKYRVLATPRSHNTPIGIALAVNSANIDDYDIFIAEMGARHTGDIAELCEICPPDISLITGVCGQHLETFGTFENIVKAKGEILAYTKDIALISSDCYALFEPFGCNKRVSDCAADIVCTENGTEFTLNLGGRSRRVKTCLLGEHSARNIALAAEAAYEAGMTLDEICDSVGTIPFIEHRLQLIENNGVNILDDGYNSNVKGARAALEVLKLFKGRKIVVTPGLVELGVLEEEENSLLGKSLVGFDFVILVGDSLIVPARKGYEEGGGDMSAIITRPNLFAAQEELKSYLRAGDTVLFLNDLPDVY